MALPPESVKCLFGANGGLAVCDIVPEAGSSGIAQYNAGADVDSTCYLVSILFWLTQKQLEMN